MKLPFAVTLGPGSSLADLTGSWRTERPVYQTLTAPCGNACPAGEDVRTWLYHAESGGDRLRGAPGARSWPSTRSPRSSAGSATTRARPPATAASSTRRSASTRSSGSSATGPSS